MLASFAVFSLVAGLFVAQPLIFVSVPVVALLGFTLLSARDPRAEVEVVRTVEKIRIRERDVSRVRLRVSNSGSTMISLLQVRDSVERELRVRNGRYGFSVVLGPGETKDVYYEIVAQTFGIHTLGPIALSVQDSTGLFESHAQLKAYSKVVAFPEATERLEHFPIRPSRTKPWPGEISSRRSGTGMDYHNIREFLPGESAKRINWRASARRAPDDNLLINEYMAELGAEVLLVVDPGIAVNARSRRDPVLTHTVKAALSIAERLLHDRNRVGLLTGGANPRRLAPEYGRRQFDRIAMSLLQLEPGEADLRWWVERSVTLLFPNVSQVVLVSALMHDGAIRAAEELARGKGHDLIIVSPNPIDLLTQGSKARRSRELVMARRVVELERAAEMARLSSANALVIDWGPAGSLEQVIEAHRRSFARHAGLVAGRNR